jgi:membrane-associated HD superfamily phosphohydrolase
MKISISVAIAIAFGVIVLLGYFVDIPLLRLMTGVFLQYAAILAAVALLLGLVNLFSVHWRKAARKEKGNIYSVIVLISFGITALIVAYFGPTAEWSMWIFNNIQIPIETSLMALLVVILIFASIRLVRKRMNWFTLVFIGTALIMLLGSAPLFGVELPILHGPNGLRSIISQIPVTAGARGLLFGVALGTIATGLRILIGSDRPYGG